jgi:hypothetical protein
MGSSDRLFKVRAALDLHTGLLVAADCHNAVIRHTLVPYVDRVFFDVVERSM